MKSLTSKFLMSSLLILSSCATRAGREARMQQAEEGGVPFTPVDVSTLGTAQLAVGKQKACSSEEEIFAIYAASPQNTLDFFEVRMCKSGTLSCETKSFLGDNLVWSPPTGIYDVSVRSCVIPEHSVNTEYLCNAWSEPAKVRAEQVATRIKAYVSELDHIREQMKETCQNIQKAMLGYLAQEKENLPLKKAVQEHLSNVSVETCQALMLSDEFQAVEALSDEIATTDFLLSNQQRVFQKNSSYTEGALFFLFGLAGVSVFGHEAYTTFHNSYSATYLSLQKQIWELNKKKWRLNEYLYDEQLKALRYLDEHIRMFEPAGGESTFREGISHVRIVAIDRMINEWKGQVDWANPPSSEYVIGNQLNEQKIKNDLLAVLDNEQNLKNVFYNIRNTLLGKQVASGGMISTVTTLFSSINWNYVPPATAEAEFEDFNKRIKEIRDFDNNYQIAIKYYNDMITEKQKQDSKLMVDSVPNIGDEFAKLSIEQAQSYANVKKRVKELRAGVEATKALGQAKYEESAATLAYKTLTSAAAGGAQGGLAGGLTGGLIGHYLSPFGVGAGQAALYGGGVGAAAGAGTAAYKEWKEGVERMEEPKWSLVEQGLLKDMGQALQKNGLRVAHREQIDLIVKQINSEIKVIKKQQKNDRAGILKRLRNAKLPIAGALISAGAAALGVRITCENLGACDESLYLAGKEEEDTRKTAALKAFVEQYEMNIRVAKSLHNKYAYITRELAGGKCTVQL